MSQDNKPVKDALIKLYGDGCFYLRGNIDEKIKNKVIVTYKQYKKQKHFKGRKIENQLTLHHLIHRFEGGKTNIENGANLSRSVHDYIHTLPREQEEIINNELRKFKYNIDVACLRITDNNINIDKSEEIDFNKGDIFEIPVYDQDKKYHIKEKKYYSEKQEMQNFIQQYVDR